MEDLKKVYKETNVILGILGKKYKNKLPKKMINFLEEKEDKIYNPQITLDDLYTSKILPETKVLICMLYINYWTETEEEKEKYKDMLKETKEKEKINTDIYNIFDTPKIEKEESTKEVNNEIVQKKENKFLFSKIKEKIMSFFNKNKK